MSFGLTHYASRKAAREFLPPLVAKGGDIRVLLVPRRRGRIMDLCVERWLEGVRLECVGIHFFHANQSQSAAVFMRNCYLGYLTVKREIVTNFKDLT